MENKKVLIIYNKLFHYRIPIFNILASRYDLTVAYSYETSDDIIAQCNFKTMFLPIKKIWKFTIHKANLHKLAKNYDVVIGYGETAWLSISSLVFAKKNYRFLLWNIGAPAGYNRRFGEASKLHYKFNDFFNKRADGLVFYTDAPIKMHRYRGMNNQSFFVANNTVRIKKIFPKDSEKEYLLFIGTLYLEKGLQALLDAYNKAYQKDYNIPGLKIVGGGSQHDIVEKWISTHNLSEKINLLGPIYDEETKAEIFSESLACISPLQAGLSVLESMGYGVPFITTKGAITGGESFNIVNGVNGVELENIEELENVILDIHQNRDKYYKYGENAYQHYWSSRKPDDMAQGLIDAIENENSL